MQALAAGRGHKLYAKTCATPSSDGVARAKALMARRKLVLSGQVHALALLRLF